MSDLMEALELATKKRRKTKKAALSKLGNKKAASSWYEYWGFGGGSANPTGASPLGRGFGDQSHVVTNLAYAAGILGACYAAEKATGCVSTSLRTFSRQLEKVVANITDVPLFTPDGEEPETPAPRWSLPGARLRHRLSRNGRGSPSAVAATEDRERAAVHQRRRISEIDDDDENRDNDVDDDDDDSNSSCARTVTNDSSSTLGGHSALVTDLSTSGSDVVAHALADRSMRSNGTAGTESTNNDSLPHFFSSTKLLACLDLEESRALFESARIVRLAPEETLFHSGDPSNGGTYIVVEGSLGVFQTDGPVTGGAPGDATSGAHPGQAGQWSDTESDNLKPMHTNTLQEGESVGDLDVVDGNRRTVTCVALEEGAVLVEISRELFIDFVSEKPRALQVYLQQAIARLWRVAHFVLNDTLGIPQSKRKNELFDLVPSKEVGLLDGELLSLLLENQVGHHVCLPTGVSLYEEGTPADAFYILLKGKMLIEKTSKGEAGGVTQCTADIVSPHCIIGSTAYFTSTVRRQSVRALEFSELVAIGVVELEKLRITSSKAFVSLLVTAAKAMGPLIRKFISLGLNRVWLHAHDIPFRQGDPSSSIYITISGRMILAHQDERTGKVQTEEVAGRGEAIGAVWSLAEGQHEKTAMCTRDSELVRMSRGAFQCISNKYPAAAVRLLEGMAQRMAGASNPAKGGKKLGPGFQVHGGGGGGGQKKRVATVALIPLEGQTKLCDAMASELKEALEKLGPTLLLSGAKVGMAFPVVAERLSNRFYRSKLTAWMAAQEEDYTYILLQADSEVTEWSKICVAQADCVLLLSSAKENPQVSAFEHNLVWRHVNRTQMNLTEVALQAFRVELLLVHQDRQPPTETSAWLQERPGLERHHHMVREDLKDMERLARWLSGKAVGLVLSGGGSRGLAHLGVLRALDDAGVPIDIVGGTSQGAFMAALFAQRLAWDRMFNCVQDYAAGLGSFRSVMKDLTLPILSLFAGTGFSALVAKCLKYGPHNIEDLWLRFFCVSTNLSKGEPSVHESGPLSTLVRASMSVVGLLPPVFYKNDLLVDGGYLNNIPVDVMRTQMGVDTLIVVDVEDKDFCTWKDLAPYESGLSGFFLLWESIRSCVSRKPFRYPRYGEMINSLMFLSHQQQIRATMRDFHVDLYMQPTGVQFYRLMDYHLMDRIVRDAYRYGWTKVAEWTASTCHTEGDSSSTMKLRTRRLSKAHSLNFVRSIRSAHPHQESSVERIRNQLLQRAITGTGGEEGKRVAGSASDLTSPANGGEMGRQGDVDGNGSGLGQGPDQSGDGLGDGCGEPAFVMEDFYPVPSALKRKVKSCAVLI